MRNSTSSMLALAGAAAYVLGLLALGARVACAGAPVGRGPEAGAPPPADAGSPPPADADATAPSKTCLASLRERGVDFIEWPTKGVRTPVRLVGSNLGPLRLVILDR